LDQGNIVDRATNWELQLDWRDATNPKRRRRRERYKTSENRSAVKRKGSSQWIRTSAYSADGVADRLVGGAADRLAEFDIAADWDLAEGDCNILKIPKIILNFLKLLHHAGCYDCYCCQTINNYKESKSKQREG
jgi:hypothetical protein